MGASIQVTPDESHDLCQSFRHSGWKHRRTQTLAALRKSGSTDSTLKRFSVCGQRAWVMSSQTDPERFRLCLNRCRNRWCVPCATEKRRTLQSNIRAACEGKELRFLTLTMKSADVGLGEQLTRMRTCFKKLRQHKEMRGIMTGGVYFIEVTRNVRTRQWHPHLHVLFEGQYQHKKTWSRLWFEVTGDSYIIDIRRVNDSSQAAGYISKYAGKPISAKILGDMAAFMEMIGAFFGAKTFHVFGDWRNLELSKPRADETEWLPIMPLGLCIESAKNGNLRCQHMLDLLRRRTSDEPLDDESDTT